MRRATIEDRDALIELWKAMSLPAESLEKRLTEFQVALSRDQTLAGAVGLQINGKQGRIHSEAFVDFAQAESLRDVLWERLQSVANNHGLVRLWTTESAPFWKHNGLTPADAETLKKRPDTWADSDETWLTLKLREDLDEALDLDKEFSMFMESERRESQRMMEQARMLKIMVTLFAILLFAGVIAFGIFVLQRNPGLLDR